MNGAHKNLTVSGTNMVQTWPVYYPNIEKDTEESARQIWSMNSYGNSFYVILKTPLLLNPAFPFFLVQKKQVKHTTSLVICYLC